jgi:hypothetical protein
MLILSGVLVGPALNQEHLQLQNLFHSLAFSKLLYYNCSVDHFPGTDWGLFTKMKGMYNFAYSLTLSGYMRKLQERSVPFTP